MRPLNLFRYLQILDASFKNFQGNNTAQMAGLCSDLGTAPGLKPSLMACLQRYRWERNAGRFTSVRCDTPPPPPPRYYTASPAELCCFRNTRSIFRGDDVFFCVSLTLSLLAVLWLLDVEGWPLLGTPFPLAIVEYLLSLEVSWRLLSSALETLNCFFGHL